jgi:hypothetical protein
MAIERLNFGRTRQQNVKMFTTRHGGWTRSILGPRESEVVGVEERLAARVRAPALHRCLRRFGNQTRPSDLQRTLPVAPRAPLAPLVGP